jgi:hypothetical protein
MRPQTIGRVLGTGLRVAGKMAGERLSAAVQPAAAQPAPHQSPYRVQSQAHPAANTTVRSQSTAQAARKTAPASRGVVSGVGGFLRPFKRVGSILWLEVTGVFFLLPVVVFTPNLWRMRASWAQGPDHRMFLITAMVIAVFLYLGVSSFWRARRK